MLTPSPTLPALLLLSLLSGSMTLASVFLQHEQASEPEGQKDKEPQEKEDFLDHTRDLFGDDEEIQELVDLFHEVERALVDIDDQLFEAGACGGLGGVEAAGIEKLLLATKDQSKSVVQGIDRILEVASQMNSSSSGSSSGEPSSSESPLNSERDRSPKQRERTPEAPGEKPGGAQPGKEKEDRFKPEPVSEKPTGSDTSNDKGQNKKGDPHNGAKGETTPHTDDGDRWGELPQRVQETFRTQGRTELPAQYRDWIDAYYRRLNRRQ